MNNGVRVVVNPLTMTYDVEMYFNFLDSAEHVEKLKGGFTHKVEAEKYLRYFTGE